MQINSLVRAEDYCTNHQIEISFINSLQQFGLLEITAEENNYYIREADLKKLEQLTRLHYDLDINIEGLDAIANLLDRLKNMQLEIMQLKTRLSIYEHL